MTKCEVKGIVPNKLRFLGWSLHWPGSGLGRGVQTQGDMSPAGLEACVGTMHSALASLGGGGEISFFP